MIVTASRFALASIHAIEQEDLMRARLSVIIALAFAANIAAGLMVSCFARWVRGIRPPTDLSLNLLADELVVEESAIRPVAPNTLSTSGATS